MIYVRACISDVYSSYLILLFYIFFFFSSRRRHTRSDRDWSSDVCSSDLGLRVGGRFRAWIERRPNLLRHSWRWLAMSAIAIVVAVTGLVTRGLDYGFEFSEIGRASCRGRGEISVGAGSLKKKKKNKKDKS